MQTSTRHNLFGAGYLLQALRLIRQQRALWGYVTVPILINLLVGAVLYGSLFLTGLHAIDLLLPAGALWGVVVGFILRWLLTALLALVVGFLVVRFGVVLGAPWYGRLSEHIEELQSGIALPDVPFNLVNALGEVWNALGFELKKLLLVLPLSLVLVLINFIPLGGQVIATAGGFAIGAIISFLDFTDAPFGRRRASFRARLGLLWNWKPTSFGFALAALALSSIPLINLLAIPICVAAGTLMVWDQVERGEQ